MSKKIRSIWLYAVIVFGMTILLILVSTLSQTKLPTDAQTKLDAASEQTQFNQTIQQSLSEITVQNNELRSQLKNTEEELAILQAELRSSNAIAQAYSSLNQAGALYLNQQYKAACDTLQTITIDTLPEEGKQLYDTLKQRLDQKGYRF